MSSHHSKTPAGHGRSAAILAAVGLVLAADPLLTSCGNGAFADAGPTVTEERPVDGVHAVDLRTSGDLAIAVGAAPKLTITAGRDTLRYLTATIQDGTVILGSRSGHNVSGDIHYELTLPALDDVVVAGSGSAHGTVVADGSFSVTASGSGSAVFDGLAATAVTVQLSGSGDIHLTGTAEAQAVVLDGSGSYLGSDLTSQRSDVRIAGSGNARVNVVTRLDAQISGSGNISYTGTPVLSTHVSGDGTVSAG